MAREIKFRAWSKELGKMFEHADIDGLRGTVRFAWNGTSEKLQSYAGTKYEEDCIPMQFTGLFDKNGKEVYEGDIVACDDGGEYFTYEGHDEYPEKYQIAWNEDGACFFLDGKTDMEISPFYGYATLEVIGNIYENPELLK